MNKTIAASVVAAAAVFGGVWYFAADHSAADAARVHAPEVPAVAAEAMPDVTSPAAPAPVTPTDPNGRPVPADPRLIALMASPQDALIEYVKDADGRVIQELDNDPGSARYQKPIREYMYAGGSVAGLTTYRSVGGQVEVSRVMVSYKPDGSIDEYRQSVEHVK